MASSNPNLPPYLRANGNTIANLYSRGDGDRGLFGRIDEGTAIRNVGIIDGVIYGGDGSDDIGLLAGINEGGTIIASYAIGEVNGGDGSDTVGGLIGNSSGDIIASYATATVNDGDGGDTVGGLIGSSSGNIIASYATGDVDDGSGNLDRVGGLVGWNNNGMIIASYAIGDADGGEGVADLVGGLVGINSGTLVASYGFGTVMGEETRGADRSDDANPSIHSPAALTAATSSITPANRWNETVWSFGDNLLYPVRHLDNWHTIATTNAISPANKRCCPSGTTCGDPAPRTARQRPTTETKTWFPPPPRPRRRRPSALPISQ